MNGQPKSGVFNSRNISLFAYSYNSPVRYLDPNGMLTEDGTIESGDTFNEIAEQKNISPDQLHAINPQVRDRDKIFAGDKLNTPGQTVNLRESKQEQMLRENGDVSGYYMARAARGDNYARTGINVVQHSGFMGKTANWGLAGTALINGVSYDEYDVNVALMNAHSAAVNTDSVNIHGLLSPNQISDYHHDVFEDMGLPKATFGGTPVTGQNFEIPFWRALGFEWCDGCDKKP